MASWAAKTTKWRICLNIALKGHHRYETDERTLSHPNSDLLTVVVCFFYLQYIQRKRKSLRSWFLSIATCCFTDLLHNDADADIGGVSKRCLVNSVHWIYRVSILPLFLLMCAFYYASSIFFAGLIMAAAQVHPSCIRISNSTDIADYGSPFFNAFALSWNTFATTGYGNVYPALGNQNNESTHCFVVTIICSTESFLGVLYVGFCGAILFGKVLRIHSHAQVTFSDPVVIQYGSGVDEGPFRREIAKSEIKTRVNPPRKKIPPPVLEFRVVNRLFNESGGEIIDANLNVVASIEAKDDDSKEQDPMDPNGRWRRSGSSATKSLMGRVRQKSLNSSTSDQTSRDVLSSSSDHPPLRSGNRLSSLVSSFNSSFFDRLVLVKQHGESDHMDHLCPEGDQEEDASGQLLIKRIFVKMNIEASSHPFFKRVWLARHILDETSPIVKASVRRQIRRLGGSWPEKLNSYTGVRESLFFNRILVSLTGTANISASSVYAQKIYHFEDCNIGYQFVHMMYKDSEGETQVRPDLINDVMEQHGGGGEPLFVGHNV